MGYDPNQTYACPTCSKPLTPSTGLGDDGIPLKLWCMEPEGHEMTSFDPRTDAINSLTPNDSFETHTDDETPIAETIADATDVLDEAKTATSVGATELVDTSDLSTVTTPTNDFKLDPHVLVAANAPAYLKDKTDKLLARCEIALTLNDKVLLYGPPGTGKSSIAAALALRGRNLSAITMTPETPMFELRGGDAIREGTMFWRDGVLTRAIRHGHRVILDEIDHSGPDAISFLHAALDDRYAFMKKGYTLPSGETIFPHEHYQVVATMNGMPKHLTPALKSRLAVAIHVDMPFPQVLDAIHPSMRTAALNCIINGKTGSREWIRVTDNYSALKDTHGWNDKDALTEAMGLVFGESASDFMGDITLGQAPKPK